jgi:hypothetical protein
MSSLMADERRAETEVENRGIVLARISKGFGLKARELILFFVPRPEGQGN